MPYDVRTPDGQLSYESLYDVERAYAQGLVAPDDEVRVPNGEWQKAKDIPAFRHTKPASVSRSPVRGTMIVICVLGVVALGLLFTHHLYSAIGVSLVIAAFCMQLTTRAFRR